MKERPILFSGSMVRAILGGHKTQTRRIVNPQPAFIGDENNSVLGHTESALDGKCPYGQPGDRLNVKEHTWMWCEKVPNGTTEKGRPKFRYVPMRYAKVFYCADHPEKPTIKVVSEYRGYEWGWRKKIGRFMPRWACRITLEITKVRVERLQDISPADCRAEGMPAENNDVGVRYGYGQLWNQINEKRGYGWAINPWVWVIEFRRIPQ